MSVCDLIETLQQYPEDAEVRLAHQPSWPFEYAVQQVGATVDGMAELEYAECMAADAAFDGGEFSGPAHADHDPVVIVYIAEGSQLGYLPAGAAQAVEW